MAKPNSPISTHKKAQILTQISKEIVQMPYCEVRLPPPKIIVILLNYLSHAPHKYETVSLSFSYLSK